MPATTTDSSAPKHGRHAAAAPKHPTAGGRPAASAASHAASRQRANRSDALSRLHNLPEIDPSDVDGAEQAAPAPIGVDPAATGSFKRIDAAEAARLTTRDNVMQMADETGRIHVGDIEAAQRRMSGHARPKVKRREAATKTSRRFIAVIAIVVVLVLAAGFIFLRGALTSVVDASGSSSEQAQVSPDTSLIYRGTSYAIARQDDGSYALTGTPANGGDTTQLFSFTGTPVSLAIYNGAVIIPENKSDGTWDVLAYTLGSGSVASQMINSDGTPVTGKGKLASAMIDGPTLTLTDDSGNQTSVPLT